MLIATSDVPFPRPMRPLPNKKDAADLRVRSFAIKKIDKALALIGSAYTRREGIYTACKESLFGLEELEQLPLAARRYLTMLLSVLVPIPNVDPNEQARLSVTWLTEGDMLLFVDDLLSLRRYLQQCDIG